MNNSEKMVLIVGIAIILSFALTLTVAQTGGRMGFGHGMGRDMEDVVKVKMFFSTLNILLIGVLLWYYSTIYRDIPNRFTLSLIIFSAALLLYALSSNPLVHQTLGFRGTGLGPFAFIPDLFATLAVIVLLNQSYE